MGSIRGSGQIESRQDSQLVSSVLSRVTLFPSGQVHHLGVLQNFALQLSGQLGPFFHLGSFQCHPCFSFQVGFHNIFCMLLPLETVWKIHLTQNSAVHLLKACKKHTDLFIYTKIHILNFPLGSRCLGHYLYCFLACFQMLDNFTFKSCITQAPSTSGNIFSLHIHPCNQAFQESFLQVSWDHSSKTAMIAFAQRYHLLGREIHQEATGTFFCDNSHLADCPSQQHSQRTDFSVLLPTWGNNFSHTKTVILSVCRKSIKVTYCKAAQHLQNEIMILTLVKSTTYSMVFKNPT